ncbi:unnamed protein product [Litomosoides sigmodontis]|uniref:BRICHOS domain-containing protein n=1 Tax=Litomosoides sigmodontis TaxID=42156 RepID=A0A3P6SLG9_LITSI|nr:unnamed protein product [Litomosoides sigmodontis]
MDYESPAKKVEQQEIIEHYITESRRTPGTSGARVPLQEILKETVERRYSEELPVRDRYRISQNSMQQTSSTSNSEAERRFYATGERDCSRDASFMQTSGTSVGGQMDSDNLDRSAPNIHSYGYDVHEVHTSGGGARIVQTHGTGLIHSDESVIEQTERTLNERRTRGDRSVEHRRITLIEERGEKKHLKVPSPLRASHKEVAFHDSTRSTVDYLKPVYTLPLSSGEKTEAYRRLDILPEESKLSRKDSYKRMQMGQQDDSTDVYVPRSDASLIADFAKSRSQLSDEIPSLWERMAQFMRKIFSRARNATWTPRLICLLLLFSLFVILFFILLAVVLNALFGSYSERTLYLYPPACKKCHPPAVSTTNNQIPSILHVSFHGSSQARFDLLGNLPFRSNSSSVIDFDTGYVAIADHALISRAGRQFACFLVPLDRSAIPTIPALRDALSSVTSEIYSEYGWQEYWQYNAEAIDSKVARRKFSNKIDICQSARWYLLKHTVYTSDSSCSNCYDFCLPNYAIQRLHKYEDDMTIGIRRLDCFRLHVQEWEKYQIHPDSQGGHWSYPKISSMRPETLLGN